jgi:hypothetical protein
MALALMGVGVLSGSGPIGAGSAIPKTTPKRKAGNNHRTYRPRLNTAQDRDIAAHNAEVDRRKAEKLARKLAR